jgi:hypothetical protein
MCTFQFSFIIYFTSPNQWVLGATTPEVKRPEPEADHSHLSSADVKNGGVVPPLLHVFKGQLYLFRV